jgi:hypothetical protein
VSVLRPGNRPFGPNLRVFSGGKVIVVEEMKVRVKTNRGGMMETNLGLKLLVQILVYGTTAVLVTKLFLQAVGLDGSSRMILSKLHQAHPDETEEDRE